MKTYKQPGHSKSGGILLMVMLVILLISILAIGLLKLAETNAVEGVYAKQSKQAFWLAEAGLQDAIQQLKSLQSYRDSPLAFTNTYGKGSYEVSVPLVEDDQFAVNPTTNYTIVSVGRVRNMTRRVTQIVSATPGSPFTFHAVGGVSTFNSNSKVEGSGIVYPGATLNTGNNGTVEIEEVIYAESGSVTGDGTFSQLEPPPVSPPTLDTSIYTVPIGNVYSDVSAPLVKLKSVTSIPANVYYTNNVIFSKSLSVGSGVTTIGASGDLTFSQTVTFSNPIRIVAGGNITFSSKVLPLPAGSTIIARGNVVISGGTQIGRNVRIYAGQDVLMGNQMTIDGGTIMYAHRDLTIASGGTSIIAPSGLGIALLANRNISLSSNMKPFTGIIYSNTGTVALSSNIDIYGTVIGQLGFTAASNVDFFYAPSVFDLDLAGIGININDVLISKGKWEERSSL